MGAPCTKVSRDQLQESRGGGFIDGDSPSWEKSNTKKLLGSLKRVGPEPVTLNVYDIGGGPGQVLNCCLASLGTGAFHVGVEVYGAEFSFGYEETDGTGVFLSTPRACREHAYSQSVPMGITTTTEAQVYRLVYHLSREWPAEAYDIVSKNCCHFAEDLCLKLGVGHIPGFLHNLADFGMVMDRDLQDLADLQCCESLAGETGLQCAKASGAVRTCRATAEAGDAPDQSDVSYLL